ncbi:InlB B-repeat-containing protein [Paenibacillus chibensis]|uniref:InlB B-repeat-containing protein n=1 Tax=Paenibacillus chibensis TaxID=59846 RepID=A0ABU6PT41_9BACL|nr:InlB B-repeat-containing protein [Paenibacillus chibensis]
MSNKWTAWSVLIAMLASLLSGIGPGAGRAHASGVTYTQVEAGGAFTLALDDQGNIWAWGNNKEGELGNGSTTSTNVPVKLTVTDEGTPVRFVGISAGSQHSVALDSNGNVWAWGENRKGAAGIGTTSIVVPVPTKSLITDVKEITAGAHVTMAVKKDGTVWSWGDNYYGDVGVDLGIANPYINYTATPVQVKYSNGTDLVPLKAKTVSGGYNASFAIDTNNILWYWGTLNTTKNGLPAKVLDANGQEFKAKAVAAGNDFYAVLDLSGNVWTVGSNYGGALGTGINSFDAITEKPEKVTGVSNVTAITAGYAHVLAMDASKKVWSWGLNSYSQLGNKTSSSSTVPVQVKNNNGTFFTGSSMVRAGGSYTDSFSVALKSGRIISWGANTSKQILSTDEALVGAGNNKNFAEMKDAYTVTFNSQGGSAVTALTNVASGNKITAPAPPTKAGYFFGGWYLESSCQTPWDFAADPVMSDLTLYAKWTAYRVTYNGNGSTGGTVPVDGNDYVQGSTVTVLGNPGNLERTNYAFAGWNTKADGTGTGYAQNATFKMGTAHVMLYAVWSPTYSVTYDGNGSAGGSVPTDSGSYLPGATVTVQGNTGSLTRPNHKFMNWNTKADGTGTSYAGNETFPMVAGHVVLYAQWIPAYMVTYDGNGSTGGSVPKDNALYEDGVSATVKGNVGSLVRTGFKFVNWNTKADGTGTSYAANAKLQMGTEDVMLYAQWIPAYKVIYNENSGTGYLPPVDNNLYEEGETVTVKAGAMLRKNYKFNDWNTAPDGTGIHYAANNTFKMGTKDVVLYVEWVPAYKVTYNGNGHTGSGIPNDTTLYEVGATVTVKDPSSMVRPNYLFAGWNTMADGTGMSYAFRDTFPMGTDNVVLYAQWIPTYTVTYNGNAYSGGSLPTDITKYLQGATVTVKGSGTLFRTYYTFAGWNTKSDGTGTGYAPNDTFLMGTANVILYAQWRGIPASVGISGVDSITVHASGSVHAGYTATVKNQAGTVLKDEKVTWSLTTATTSVSVDAVTGEVTVTSDASAGDSFTLVATSVSNAAITQTKTVVLVLPYAASIDIAGASSIEVPATGSASSSYTATVKDQTGAAMSGETVVWSLQAATTGVSVDAATGEVTVTSDAAAGDRFTLVATSVSNAAITQTKTVVLNAEARVAASIDIAGAGSVQVPARGSVSSSYAAKMKDQTGAVMSGETVVWSLQAATTGVSVNAATGEVTVTNEAAAGDMFVLVATSVSNTAITQTKTVVLNAEAPVATSVDIAGAGLVQVPARGSVSSSYAATVKDQTGAAMSGETVVWSLQAATTGVSVDAVTGEVTVTSEAAAGDTFTLVATSVSNAAITQTKTVVLTDQVQSNDANLIRLTLSAAELSPGFTSDTLIYDATVNYGTTSVTVTPTKSHPDASIVVQGLPVISGTPSQSIPLAVGMNEITITVTAGDGVTTKTYQIKVWREQAAAGGGSSPGDGGISSGSGTSAPPPATGTEIVTVDVAAGDKGVVSKTQIERTKNADGTMSDKVTFIPAKAIESVERTKEAGADTVRILIPDPKDNVKEVRVDLPPMAIRTVAGSGLALQIYTDNGSITIPNASLQNLNPDLYFRLVPIKQETERKQVEERAKKEQAVREVLGDGSVRVVGRPMTIETNMSSRQVSITLPLDRSLLPQDSKEREKFLSDLAVFIEHSDGDKELVRPELGEYPDGRLGLFFTIEKFSTFTILNMENRTRTHEAYINGYPDHTFKPGHSITRAEMAAILSRVAEGVPAGPGIHYPDVSGKHWAYDSIKNAGQNGLMNGYPDGSFKPEGAITRAELAAILARWMKLSETESPGYTDVSGHWAEMSIAQVSQAGYMMGYPNGSFMPDSALTRAEAVAVINRVLKRGPLYGIAGSTWSDVSGDHWALHEIEEASQNHSYVTRLEGGESKAK